jgi:mono/diheme cytochrome c family protein
MAACALLIIAVAAAWYRVAERQRREMALGEKLYALNCAVCHGRDLQGQPNWQTPKADGKMPAPPLNATGHAPHHRDAELFRIVKRGAAAVNNRPSDMAPFESVLSDDEISAILSYIKSTW